MTGTGAYPPERLPTLTEVIDPLHTRPSAGGGEDVDATERRRVVVPVLAERRRAAWAPSIARALPPLEAQLTQRVLDEVRQQIDPKLEYRLREAIAPVLARVADNLVRELRTELASTLRDVVSRAVDEEIARHRGSSAER